VLAKEVRGSPRKKNGFQAPVLVALSEKPNEINKLVIPAGFEPATYCLEGSCSIQLS
jgi:hypothetical protein